MIKMKDFVHLIIFMIAARSVAGFYFGVPEQSWADSAAICLLVPKEDVNGKEFAGNFSVYTKNITTVWTGTKVKYSKWTAFIGCKSDKAMTPINNTGSKLSINECALKCSDNPAYTNFAVQNRECHCLENTEPDATITDCRKECSITDTVLCSSGQSSMLFKLITDLKVSSNSTFIEEECVTTELVSKKFANYQVNDCKQKFEFECSNSSDYQLPLNWFAYQERCFKDKKSILYGKNYVGTTFNDDTKKRIWTPIFRAHRLTTTGQPSNGELCIARVKNDGDSNYQYTVQNCSTKFPLLCERSGQQINNNDDSDNTLFPRYITMSVSDSVVIAVVIVSSVLGTALPISIGVICHLKKKLKLASFTSLTVGRDQAFYSAVSQNQESSTQRNDATRDRESVPQIDLQGYLVSSQNPSSQNKDHYDYVL